MRWSQPDKHAPGCWAPENAADAEELEFRESRRRAEEEPEPNEEEADD